jgi:hypothetical protein
VPKETMVLDEYISEVDTKVNVQEDIEVEEESRKSTLTLDTMHATILNPMYYVVTIIS